MAVSLFLLAAGVWSQDFTWAFYANMVGILQPSENLLRVEDALGLLGWVRYLQIKQWGNDMARLYGRYMVIERDEESRCIHAADYYSHRGRINTIG